MLIVIMDIVKTRSAFVWMVTNTKKIALLLCVSIFAQSADGESDKIVSDKEKTF